ncbi:MAG: phosphoglycolate phosphatase [Minisyncoccia bacterium]
MSDIKLIAFDYDRVLTDENLNFDVELVKYINEMKNNGIVVGIITGRRWAYIEKMKNFFDFIVYENGFFLYYNGHIKLCNEQQEKIAKEAKSYFISRRIDCIFGELMISCPMDKLEYVQKIKNIISELEIVTNIDRFIILPKGIDKGYSLKKVLDLLKINTQNVAVVGDGENDLSMFKIAGLPICIGNSIDELRKISKLCSNKKYSKGTEEILAKLKSINYRYDENI